MGRYERKDMFYRRAKAEGRASRAYYKLEQIQGEFKLIKKGDRVLDLGCAPGGWLDEASALVGKEGRVLGIDLVPIKRGLRPWVKTIALDVGDARIVDVVIKEISRVDVVLSDMAPSTSGVKFRDSYLSYELASRAFEIARRVLRAGGNFIVKIFPGEEFSGFKKMLSENFDEVRQSRPPATRKSSIEVYLIGKGFKKTGCDDSQPAKSREKEWGIWR